MMKTYYESKIDVIDKIRAEIEEKYGEYYICEWFEDNDCEYNKSEYLLVEGVSAILEIIDKYETECEV